jgi:hypothetical protein
MEQAKKGVRFPEQNQNNLPRWRAMLQNHLWAEPAEQHFPENPNS